MFAVTLLNYLKEVRFYELKTLQKELQEHTYECLHVVVKQLYKGEKVREIALYSMRDKVVQISIAAELNKIYEDRFPQSVYAYRADHSALNAIQFIEDSILTKNYTFALKMDITHFFDEIRWDLLERELREQIEEDDVIDLIRQNTCGRILDKTSGELNEKEVGIFQGSGISPVASNVYLMKIDSWLSEEDVVYIRYADDILILGHDKDALVKLLNESILKFQTMGLRLNESKTVIKNIEDGVDTFKHVYGLLNGNHGNNLIQKNILLSSCDIYNKLSIYNVI